MNNKLIFLFGVILLLGIFIIPDTLAAEANLGTFKQNECLNIIQICDNCTYVNLTAVMYPNSTILSSNIGMSDTGSNYYTQFCNTSLEGNYIAIGIGDPNGVPTSFSYNFMVTNLGFNGEVNNDWMIPLVIVFLVLTFFFGTISFLISEDHVFMKILLLFVAMLFAIMTVTIGQLMLKGVQMFDYEVLGGIIGVVDLAYYIIVILIIVFSFYLMIGMIYYYLQWAKDRREQRVRI